MLRSACSSKADMGGTPFRRECRTLMAGTGGGERSKRGGRMVASRASLRLRLPWSWTGSRRRMEERAEAVGSTFFVDFFFCFCSSGSRQMLGMRRND
jgi:hypothetical protein